MLNEYVAKPQDQQYREAKEAEQKAFGQAQEKPLQSNDNWSSEGINPSANAIGTAISNPNSKLTTGTNGSKVTTDVNAAGVQDRMQNRSIQWHTASDDEKKSLHEANLADANYLKSLGVNVNFNGLDGTYRYNDDKSNLYNTTYKPESSPYPVYNSREAEIEKSYNTALEQQRAANAAAVDKAKQSALMAQMQANKAYESQKGQAALNTAASLENEKLRQALKGSNGGLGERQFGIYQAAESQALLSINQAMTQLETETKSQISQLEAEGRYQDAALVANMSLQKMEALQADYDKVYASEVNKYNYDTAKEQQTFENGLTLDQLAENKKWKELEWARTIAIDQNAIDQWAKQFDESVRQHDQQFDESVRQYDQNYAFNVADAAFTQKLQQLNMGIAMAQYDNGAMLTELGFKNDVAINDYFTKAMQAISQMTDDNQRKTAIGAFLTELAGTYFDENGNMRENPTLGGTISTTINANGAGTQSGATAEQEAGNANTGTEAAAPVVAENAGQKITENGSVVVGNDGKPSTGEIGIAKLINSLKQGNHTDVEVNNIIAALRDSFGINVAYNVDEGKYTYENGMPILDTEFNAPVDVDTLAKFEGRISDGIPEGASLEKDEFGLVRTTNGIDPSYMESDETIKAIRNADGTYSYYKGNLMSNGAPATGGASKGIYGTIGTGKTNGITGVAKSGYGSSVGLGYESRDVSSGGSSSGGSSSGGLMGNEQSNEDAKVAADFYYNLPYTIEDFNANADNIAAKYGTYENYVDGELTKAGLTKSQAQIIFELINAQ